MSAPIEMLLSRLDGVKQVRANGWMSRCPAHNGDGRSLAVTHADNGHILIHCFAHECEAGDILAAVGMSVGDLFPEPLPERRRFQQVRHAVPAIDVLRVMKDELAVVEVLVSDFATGTLDFSALDRGMVCAQRLRKALDLCSG
jgi:hypothetical protein